MLPALPKVHRVIGRRLRGRKMRPAITERHSRTAIRPSDSRISHLIFWIRNGHQTWTSCYGLGTMQGDMICAMQTAPSYGVSASQRHDNDPKLPRTPDEIYDLNRAVSAKMKDVFLSKGIPVVPSLGNNDVWPHVRRICMPGYHLTYS